MTQDKVSPANSQESTSVEAVASSWTAFQHKEFAVLWLATLASNIGTWMHDVGAGWLMTSLSSSPSLVASVQVATSLPIFLLALPAGAMADIVDRRRLLMTVQAVMALLAATLAILVGVERVTPAILLLITFLMGVCAAFVAPAWQAIVPQLVVREHLQSAIALNGMGVNISRAIGPALAGFLIVSIGMATPFTVNAVSFIAIIVALGWWRRSRPSQHTNLPAEPFFNAIVIGLRYARASTPLKATLVRAAAFYFFASANWSLLPLIARRELRGDARTYGILLACIGVGAVAGAAFMPRIKRRLGPDWMVATGTLIIAGVLLINATVHNVVAAAIGSLMFGIGWIAVLSTLSISAQVALPDWVRARGLSVYLMVFFGAMSAGSAVWGQVANFSNMSTPLLVAAFGAIVAIPLSWRCKLHLGSAMDLAPSMHWPLPLLADEHQHDQDGVMVTIEYRIAKHDVPEFLLAMKELATARKRLGAYAWGIWQDAAESDRFIEYFLESSWTQHLRHHERVSGSDRMIQDRVNAFHRAAFPPKVCHLLDASTHRD